MRRAGKDPFAEFVAPRPEGVAPIHAGWGTGHVVAEAVIVFGPDGWTDTLMSGDRCRFDIALRSNRPVDGLRVGLKVCTADGVAVFGTSTQGAGFEPGPLDGQRVVTFTIPALPLHEGLFSIEVTVESAEGATTYHSWPEASMFSVYSALPGTGITAVDGEWGVTSEAGQS